MNKHRKSMDMMKGPQVLHLNKHLMNDFKPSSRMKAKDHSLMVKSMTIMPAPVSASISWHKDLHRASKDSLRQKSVDSVGKDLNLLDSINVDMPANTTIDQSTFVSHKNRRMSMKTFNTLGSAYTAPPRDNSYHIKHGLPFGTKERSKKDKTFMDSHLEWASGVGDPSKYATQNDWNTQSKMRPNVSMNKAKKITSLAELMEQKKKIPGPSDFKNMDPYKPKAPGFYRNT